jgi:hypothetical protein
MIKPLQAVAVKVSVVGSTHMTPAENYYSQDAIDQLTQDLANAQAEIARLRDALLEAKQLIMDINGKSYEFIEQALSQPPASIALQEYRDMKQIAHLIGSIFFAGNFVAETANESELESLLIKNGFRYKSWDEITANENTISDTVTISKAELDALRLDAERYRRIRENWLDCDELDLHGRLSVIDNNIDEHLAIDKARTQS